MKRRGQIILYILFVIVVLLMLTLLNLDTFIAVRSKNRLENAGDAAALAAAHRQASLINEIGALNAEHLIYAWKNETAECSRVTLEQRQKCLLGPVEALKLADEAARKNGMETREEFAAILAEHVNTVRTMYVGGGENDPYPESYPGAWTEYATKIAEVVAGGLAAGPDNVEFFYASGNHLLLNRNFYNAIAGKNWCWFHFHCENVLNSYGSFHDWGPLPKAGENTMENSEIFSLHLAAKKVALTSVFTREELIELFSRYCDMELKYDDFNRGTLLDDPEETWFFFDENRWGRWFDDYHLAGDDEGGDFPIAGTIKDEYNVRGCAAACRTCDTVSATAVDMTSRFTWSAAAKPFGAVENFEEATGVVTGLGDFVVPGAMSAVRLVPLDSIGGENLATADYDWVTHLRHHLEKYLLRGPMATSGCWYCDQLQTWERKTFRHEGIVWLKLYSGTCVRGTGGGGSGGGTSHGH